jgi:hypothetical protein
MRKKLLLFCLFWAVLIGFTTISCKKMTQDYIQTLLTDGQWQLASVQVFHYTGSLEDSVVTLDTLCNMIQTFKFNTDKTCTYNNFDCITQTATGHWALSQNELLLNTDLKTTDTVASENSVPFKSAQISNLGQYSFIINTGDLETFYSPTQKRKIIVYGFIRVKTQ